MKHTFFILSLLIAACSSKKKKEVNHEHKEVVTKKIITETNELKEEELTFVEIQDSLRIQILNSKPNENLKSSILQELYIKGLVNQIKDKIRFDLPFNLHGFDCGAPDCYSTDILFEFTASYPIVFPENIDFQLVEHGCGIEKNIKENGVFELVEHTQTYVNYYSKNQKSNLIIIEDKRELYYFSDTKPNSIKVDLIEKLFEEYDEEDPKFTEPYQSTTMRNNDYGDFIRKE
ncbi:hypothetical protein QSV08_07575 [Maribacter sp. BPC-D8]|uniref:hypothetical protein n=1 Tax=Maribacter sp. BPC-D8 TaxID=3053613 RepID=UPI002B45C8E4|nr:hypothetical protein [Maribacter sp. BPC-D8]WRI31103.1 hypothetical protein QSV08_07575 [Maribacter sp. BPC-D8]